MKKLKLSLGAIALALGVFGAFAFSPTNNAAETGQFYTLPNGDMGEPVEGQNLCKDSGPICSQEYNLETELPTGNHIVEGVKR